MQDRPFVWNPNAFTFNFSKPWTQHYARARDLVNGLYNSETKNREEFIRDHLKDKPELIAQEVQKILENDMKNVNTKIANIIEQYRQIRFNSLSKSNDKVYTEAEVLSRLKQDIGQKQKLNPNQHVNNDNLASYELANKYEKCHFKKKIIKNIENEVLKVFGSLKIETTPSVKISI